MGEQLEDNYNDLMDEIIEHREHREIASISNDSIVGSSLSNFGIDINNPEENEQYILQNQDPNAIIQGIGVEDRITVKTSESGLATSISKTRDSEFSPVIIEYPREHSLRTQSLSSETSEEEVNTEAGNGELNSNKTDTEELENVCRKESVKEIELSTFDLALEKGYYEQAKIYYDDIISKGLKLKTKFMQLRYSEEGVLIKDEDVFNDSVTEIDHSELRKDFYSKESCQHIFLLVKDRNEYLENNEYAKVLKLKFTQDGSDKLKNLIEKMFFNNMYTKDKRKYLIFNRERIETLLKFFHNEIMKKNIFLVGKENQIPGNNKLENHEGNGKIPLQEMEKKNDDEFDEHGARGFSLPSCSKN